MYTHRATREMVVAGILFIDRRVNEYLVNLACSKHGSRSIDAIWNKSSPKLRENLASRLAPSESKLNSDQFGKFVSVNLGLSIFKRSKEQWLASFDKQKKTKELKIRQKLDYKTQKLDFSVI